MNHQELNAIFLRNFPHEANGEQEHFFNNLSQFVYSTNYTGFILKGYAGTGKTTLMRSVVKTYQQLKGKIVLLAATGRAAKVLSQRAGFYASTIHRHIYMASNVGGETRYVIRPNKQKHALYVVDEASMIADYSNDGQFAGTSLLEDLIQFVQNGHRCKLLFIGDDAQLPPVGTDQSPALSQSYLTNQYDMTVAMATLTQVIRQAQSSVILQNATALRALIANSPEQAPNLNMGVDVIRLNDPYDMEEVFQLCFSDVASEQGIMIVRSNKRANKYNQDIRARIQYKEDIINASDQLMVVKNNYYWTGDKSSAGFIANGDTIEVLSLRNSEQIYGHTFVEATIQLLDYPDTEPIDVKILVDVLQVDGPSLPNEAYDRLKQAVAEDYMHITNKKILAEKLKNDPYLNALQVKFAHVVTCHKAQGGQWPNVIIEQPWLPEGKTDKEYLRWLYTAFTRAQEKVFLIGFDETFFDS